MKMRKSMAMGPGVLMAATMIPAVPAMADDATGKVYYSKLQTGAADEDWQNLGKRIHRGNWYRGNWLLQQLPDSMRQLFSLRWLRAMLLLCSR